MTTNLEADYTQWSFLYNNHIDRDIRMKKCSLLWCHFLKWKRPKEVCYYKLLKYTPKTSAIKYESLKLVINRGISLGNNERTMAL